MKPIFKLTLFIFLLLTQASFATGSKLPDKKQIVDKHLKSKISFEKKIKVLTAYQFWIEEEITTNANNLSDSELTQVMQYSTLLNAIAPKKLTLKNCNSSAKKVLAEDLTPLSDEPSAPAKAILLWLKLLCAK